MLSEKKYLICGKSIFIILGSFLSYYLVSLLGLEVASINKQASLVWPASGVAISLIFFFGPRALVGIFAGAFLANFSTGLSLSATAFIALGNSLESLTFIFFYNKLSNSSKDQSIHSRSIFILFTMVLATAISASFGTAALWFSSIVPTALIAKNWITWWIGDFLGALFIFPLAFKIKHIKFDFLKLEKLQALKLLSLIFLTALLSHFIFSLEAGRPFLFLIFLALLLATSWFDSMWGYLASLAIGFYSIWQTMQGQGPFSGNSLNDNLVHLQIFLAGLSMTAIGLSSLKQEGFQFKVKLAIIFGWIFSGIAFYFAYTSAVVKDDVHFSSQIKQVTIAIEEKVNNYIKALESGESFINASEYVSKEEWQLFANRLLSRARYSGVEGIGVIFSSSIQERFKNKNSHAYRYHPNIKTHKVPSLPDQLSIVAPEDNFIITYIEPEIDNKAAVGLNISSEKHRYEAALMARDTGNAAITETIKLVQDLKSRAGFLIFVPIYQKGMKTDTVENRKLAFLGFVYAPMIFESLMATVVGASGKEISVKAIRNRDDNTFDQVYLSPSWSNDSGAIKKEKINVAGKVFDLEFKKSNQFASSASLVTSWIGFFGAMASLFLAIMISSQQNLANKAQSLADKMTKEIDDRKRIWKALTETSPVGIYLTDKDGLCTYVNPAWSKMTELSQEEAAGYGWSKALHPDDVKMITDEWNQLVAGGSFKCNYRFKRADGKVVYVSGESIPLRNEESEVTGYFGTVQDITELHLNQITAQEASRMSSLGRMASGIAHEVNNPLTIILGKALFLEKIVNNKSEADSEKAKILITEIKNTVYRIANIVRGLQSFSRESSKDQFRKTLVKDSIESTLSVCQARFLNHATPLLMPSEVSSDLLFLGSAEQISQVLLNLLNNAFDAVENLENRWVKVELAKEKDKIFILVSDSGAGISTTDQAKLFDPFFTTKEVGKGTGLGLSISRGIVERHNGKLYLDTSKINTTFVVELPALDREVV